MIHKLSDVARAPSPSVLIALVRLSLELSLFNQALEVLITIFETDDEEIEAWYLQGYCFVLMAQQARESDGEYKDMEWQKLAQDARDCLETCRSVRRLRLDRFGSLLILLVVL